MRSKFDQFVVNSFNSAILLISTYLVGVSFISERNRWRPSVPVNQRSGELVLWYTNKKNALNIQNRNEEGRSSSSKAATVSIDQKVLRHLVMFATELFGTSIVTV